MCGLLSVGSNLPSLPLYSQIQNSDLALTREGEHTSHTPSLPTQGFTYNTMQHTKSKRTVPVPSSKLLLVIFASYISYIANVRFEIAVNTNIAGSTSNTNNAGSTSNTNIAGSTLQHVQPPQQQSAAQPIHAHKLLQLDQLLQQPAMVCPAQHPKMKPGQAAPRGTCNSQAPPSYPEWNNRVHKQPAAPSTSTTSDLPSAPAPHHPSPTPTPSLKASAQTCKMASAEEPADIQHHQAHY